MRRWTQLACERLEDRSVPATFCLFSEGMIGPPPTQQPPPPPGLGTSPFSPGPIVLDLNRDGLLDLITRDLQSRVLVRTALEEGRFGAAQMLDARATLLGTCEGDLFGWDGQEVWKWTPEGVQHINPWDCLKCPDKPSGGESPLQIYGPDWTALLDLAYQKLEVIRGEEHFILPVGPNANGMQWSPLGLLISNQLGDVWRVDVDEKGPSWGPQLTALPEIQAGDLDSDDQVDYVYRSLTNQEVWVHLKNGSAYSLDTQTRSGGLTLADLDQDGYLDLIVCDEIGSKLLLYRGQGNGRFVPEWNQGQAVLVPTPRSATAAQLSSNAWLDVVVVSTQSDEVHMLWGQQTDAGYNLSVGSSYDVGPRPTDAAVVDWTGDRTPDLLITSSGDNRLVVLPGQKTVAGTGTEPILFAPSQAERIRVGSNPQQLLVGDFTGNGRADVVTLNAGSGSLTLVPDRQEKGIQVTEISTGVSAPHRAVAQDINADGHMDLIVEHLWQNTLVVIRGDSSGWSVATTLVGGPTTSDLQTPQMSRLWDLNFQTLWPAELTPPSITDPSGPSAPERPTVEFQPIGSGVVSLVPIWLGDSAPQSSGRAPTVVAIGAPLGEEDIEFLRIPGARPLEASVETAHEVVPMDREPLLSLLPGHEDSPPPELAPDGSTDPQVAPTLILPVPGLPATATETATAAPEVNPFEDFVWPEEPPLESEPREGELEDEVLHDWLENEAHSADVGMGTTDLLVWWWLPRSERTRRRPSVSAIY